MRQRRETIGFRIYSDEKKLIESVCEARGESLSQFVRLVIRRELASLSYYPQDVKKALGIKVTKLGCEQEAHP